MSLNVQNKGSVNTYMYPPELEKSTLVLYVEYFFFIQSLTLQSHRSNL